MPTYDTPNSQHTWTVPSGVASATVLIRGGSGGSGTYDNNQYPGENGIGGPGGEITATIDVSPGDEIIVYVGEDGEDGFYNSDQTSPSGSGGSGGHNQRNAAGDGGDARPIASGGGGGGAGSALVDSDTGSDLARACGGGGGGGGAYSGDSVSGGGGGGGSPGGVGGGAEGSNASSGSDAAGTGEGGNGGYADAQGGGSDGQPGGTYTDSSLTNVSTGTTTAGPVVEITPSYPPAAPTDLQAADVRATEIDITWTDPDGQPNTSPEDGYRVYTSTDGGSTWTEVADLAADTESYTITGLLNGEEYDIRVEAYNDNGTASTQ